MIERELSIIRALGEEFVTVLADLQRTLEEKMAARSGVLKGKLASLSVLLQKYVTMDEIRPVLQAMMNDVVGAVPVPCDGHDYGPEMLRQAVNDAIAKIPVSTDGKGVTADGVRLTIEQIAKDTVSHIPAPRDGRDYDPGVSQQTVNDTAAKIPIPADGKSVAAGDVHPMIEQIVKDAVSHIPAPRDGRDYDPEVLLRAMDDAVRRLPAPTDRESITPDDICPMLKQIATDVVSHIPVPRDGRDYDPEVLQKAVLDTVSALPAPQDGRDAAALEIFPAIDKQRSFPRDTYATYQDGLWRAYEKTHGMQEWECLVDEVADIDVSITGERSFTVVVRQSNGQCTEKALSLPVMLYHGVFKAGGIYHPGDTVTQGGSLWCRNSMTDDRPGEAHSSGWTLAAKRERDAGGGK